MAEVVMGKLLPNLKITLGDEDPDALLEEGELSDGEEKDNKNENSKSSVHVVRSWMPTLQGPKIYENKNGGFVTGLDLSSEVLLKKLEDRAERFGLENNEGPITQKEIYALYKSLGIDPENLNLCKVKDMRLEALHMRGVEEMKTSDIFKYFADYGAASIEWINDFSCNVVWLDKETTARALLGLSQPMDVKKKAFLSHSPVQTSETTVMKTLEDENTTKMSDSEDSDDDDDENSRDARYKKTVSSMDIDGSEVKEASNDDSTTDTVVGIPVPPGQWRLGTKHPKARAILLRFATKDDKKIAGAEKRSQFYQKYGNPNYGGLRGLISKSKKRKMQAARNRQIVEVLADDSKVDINPDDTIGEILPRPTGRHNVIKMPRMKMYADEEEEKSKGTGIKHNSKQKPCNIYSRLGTKYTKEDLFQLGKQISSDSEEEADDKVAINCTIPSRYNIWTDIALDMAKEDRSLKRTASPDSESSDIYQLPAEDLRDSLNDRSTKRARSTESESSNPGFEPMADLRTSLNKRSRAFKSSPFKSFKRTESSDSDSSDSRFRQTKDLRTSLNNRSRALKSFKRTESSDSDSSYSRFSRTKDLRTSLNNKSSRENRTRLNKSPKDFSISSRNQSKSPCLKSTVFSPYSGSKDRHKGDLRSKIKSWKDDESLTKHRSPLCKDS